MTNYVITTDFAPKDALPTGTPAKTAKGAELATELSNIATAIASKEDSANKNNPNGYTGLDSSGKISPSVVSAGSVTQFQNTTDNVGYLNVPQNSQGSNYTLVLSDAGKHLYYGGTGTVTFTIPANGTVAYPIGTAITFIVSATGTLNIACNDTMTLAGTTTTGTRTLTTNGVATAIKVTSTGWRISGSGLS
jgi:hypothetical protein